MMKRESVVEIVVERTVGGFTVKATVLEEDGAGGCPCIAGTRHFLASSTDEMTAIVRGLFEG